MAQLKATDYPALYRLLGDRNQRKIGNNTTAARTSATIITVYLHGHRIVDLHAHDDIVINLAGYPTVTTRERINQFLPAGIRLFQRNHVQFIGSQLNEIEVDSHKDYAIVKNGNGWSLMNESNIYGFAL